MACFKNPHPLKDISVGSRPKAELLNVGNELLAGSVLNTNAQYLAKELTKIGFQVAGQSTCADEISAIRTALHSAFKRSQLIFVTGGLGPTPDDLTRESLADFFHTPLIFSRTQYQQIVRHYRKRNQKVPPLVRREAYFPANAQPVLNRFGIALGFIIEESDRVLIVLPGVPGELMRMFKTRIQPYLRKRFPKLRPAASLVVNTIGLSEPTVMERLGRGFFRLGHFQFGIYPKVGEAEIRIYADSFRFVTRLKTWISRTLGDSIYSFSEETIQETIAKILTIRRWTLALAESCTGGQLAEQLTRIPGSSRYFQGGVVAYQNEVKTQILGVPKKILQTRGAVSKEAASLMAKGIREQLKSTLGVAITGIAGPTGGSDAKPLGLVYISIASAQKTRTWEEIFSGDRQQIQDRACKKALEYLWRWLQN